MKFIFSCLSAMIFLFVSLGSVIAHHQSSFAELNYQEHSEIFSVTHKDVWEVIVTSDKEKMISMSFDGLIKIWNLEDGVLLRSFNSKPDLRDIRLSVDEAQLLTYGRSGNVQIWDVETGEELYGATYEFQLFGADWFYDDSHIVVWGVGHIAVLDLETGQSDFLMECDLSISSECNVVFDLIWTEDLFVAQTGKELSGISIETGELEFVLYHDDAIQGMQLNGGYLLTWTGNNSLWIWDITTGEVVNNYVHRIGVNGAMWQETTGYVFSWAYTTVQVWDLDQDNPVLIVDLDNDVNGSVLSPLETSVASWFYQDDMLSIDVWSVETGDIALSLENQIPSQSIDWHGEDYLFTSSITPRFIIWDVHTGLVKYELSHEDEILGSLWVENNLILTWGRDGMIKLWQL